MARYYLGNIKGPKGGIGPEIQELKDKVVLGAQTTKVRMASSNEMITIQQFRGSDDNYISLGVDEGNLTIKTTNGETTKVVNEYIKRNGIEYRTYPSNNRNWKEVFEEIFLNIDIGATTKFKIEYNAMTGTPVDGSTRLCEMTKHDSENAIVTCSVLNSTLWFILRDGNGWDEWIRVSDSNNSYLLAGGIEIPEGSDLKAEKYKKAGNYYCSNNNKAKTLINCPLSEAFVMKVDYATGYAYPRQTFIRFNDGFTTLRMYDPYSSKDDKWEKDVYKVNCRYLKNLNQEHYDGQFEIFRYDENTLNSPLKEGITESREGIVFHKSIQNLATQVAIPTSDEILYIRKRKTDGNWTGWIKVGHDPWNFLGVYDLTGNDYERIAIDPSAIEVLLIVGAPNPSDSTQVFGGKTYTLPMTGNIYNVIADKMFYNGNGSSTAGNFYAHIDNASTLKLKDNDNFLRCRVYWR